MKDQELRGGCLAVVGVLFVFLLVALWILLQPGSLLGYWAWGVGTDEVGVKLDRGVFVEVLGPNYYSAPFELGADIQNVSVKAIPVELLEQQVLSNQRDQQELFFDVKFNAFRPIGINAEQWRNYRTYYTNDDLLKAFVRDAAADAIRVCANASTFQEAVGEGRSTISDCIIGRLDTAFVEEGIRVENMFITTIDPSEEARKKLEEIRAINQERDAANANAQLAEANVRATSVVIEAGYNAVSTEAAAKEQSIRAGQAVLDATATLAAADANYRLALSQINLQIAQIKAQADYADEAALAEIYAQYPQYAEVITQEFLARSLVNVQWGYLQPGQNPLTVIHSSGGELGYVVPSAGFPTPTPSAP